MVKNINIYKIDKMKKEGDMRDFLRYKTLFPITLFY